MALALLLPGYEHTPRDMAGTAWRFVHRFEQVTETLSPNAVAFSNSNPDEVWILDYISLFGVAGGTAALTRFRLQLQDLSGNRLTNIFTEFFSPSIAAGVEMGRRVQGELVIPPFTRLHFQATFSIPDTNIASIGFSGIAVPRGNLG